MMQDAFFCTVGELAAMGRENIPPQFISGAHLIYSSPATLAFNSPGAEGFGVKRAGLAIYYADRGTGMLRQKYIIDQFYERI